MSYQKGNGGELEIARLLEPWLQQRWPMALVVRTPRSGGWVHGRDAFNARGDLMTKDCRFSFCVEVKRREGWSPRELISGNASPVWKWWAQTRADADAVRLQPILFFRRNLKAWHVMMDLPFVLERCRRLRTSPLPEPYYTWPWKSALPWRDTIIVRLSWFLSTDPSIWVDDPPPEPRRGRVRAKTIF